MPNREAKDIPYVGLGLIFGAAVGFALGGPVGAGMGAGVGLVVGAIARSLIKRQTESSESDWDSRDHTEKAR
jgi:outer membrane lipoprotein SlyB